MSVNKFQDDKLIKVSGGLTSASNISFKDNIGGIEVNNVKESLDILNTQKVDKENILGSLSDVIASNNEQNIASAKSIKELNNNINTFNSSFTGLFKVVQWNTGSFNIPAVSDTMLSKDIYVSGYTPIAIVGWANGAMSHFYISRMRISNNSAIFTLASIHTSDFSGANLTYRVLYIKNDIY